MVFVKKYLCLVVGIALILLTKHSTAQSVSKVIEFRDGSMITLEMTDEMIPWQRIAKDGAVTKEPRKLSSTSLLSFAVQPATEHVSRIRQQLSKLGSSIYSERETAQRELIETGAKFKDIIMQYQTEDREISWRLNEVKERIDEKDDSNQVISQYDHMVETGQTQRIEGDLGDWKIEGTYVGQKVSFDRASVRLVRDAAVEKSGVDTAVEVVVNRNERVPQPEDGPVDAGFSVVDFEKRPNGKKINRDEDVTRAYVDYGVILEGENTESSVIVKRYNCGSRSGALCAANEEPAYQGVMRIRFCIPGKPDFKAGVNFVGLFIAHVKKLGTSLQAYDSYGNLLKEIKTDVTAESMGSDFLSVTSNVPIAYIRLVPHPEIDKDFAIDDIYLDTPQPLVDSGAPDKYTVLTKTGDRLLAEKLEYQGDKVVLSDLSIGVEKLEVNLSDVYVTAFPIEDAVRSNSFELPFVWLNDGSIMRAKIGSTASLARMEKSNLTTEEIIALWGADTRMRIAEESEFDGKSSIVIRQDNTVEQLTSPKLGEKWITCEEVEDRADFELLTYSTSPVVYFQKPGKRLGSTGFVQTQDGEQINFGKGTKCQFKSVSQDGVVLKFTGQDKTTGEFTIPIEQLRSLRFPKE